MQNRDKIGRRRFGQTLAGSAVALTSNQSPAQTPPADANLRSARQDLQQASRAIAQVPLPREVEPAFRFKA